MLCPSRSVSLPCPTDTKSRAERWDWPLLLPSLRLGWFLTTVTLAGRLSVVGKPAHCWKSTAVTLCRAERAPCRSHCISGWKRKETFYGNFFNDFPIFFLGKLSAITYSVPEGINYSLVLIVRISYSVLLDVMSALDRVRGHMAFLFPSFFPCSVLSVRLLV